MKYIKTLALVLCSAQFLQAQEQIPPEKQSLSINVDGLLFFKNNEFESPLMDGYSLPGFRLTPTIEYSLNGNIKIQAGAYLLHYWGARQYPNVPYFGIPDYAYENASKGVHALPFLRCQMDIGSWKFILGDVIEDNCHNLLRPMYAPERQLTADPEAGLQIMHSGRWLDFDAWLDWRTFIYKGSPYQENFFVGLSSKIKYTNPESRIQAYTPIQLMIEHRGGEIDTLVSNSVQTFMNFAGGLGVEYKVDAKWLRNVSAEADILGSYQQAGKTWPWEKGWAVYTHAQAQIWNAKASLGYYHADKFITIEGLPLWSVCNQDGSVFYKSLNMAYFGIEYVKTLHPGYQLIAKTDWYFAQSKTNFAIELAMRFTPTWSLWQK